MIESDVRKENRGDLRKRERHAGSHAELHVRRFHAQPLCFDLPAVLLKRMLRKAGHQN